MACFRLTCLLGLVFVPPVAADIDDLMDKLDAIVSTVAAGQTPSIAEFTSASSELYSAMEQAAKFEYFSPANKNKIKSIKDKVKSALFSLSTTKAKDAFFEAYDLITDFVQSMTDAYKAKSVAFAAKFEAKMDFLADADSFNALFDTFDEDDKSDLINVLEDYIENDDDDDKVVQLRASMKANGTLTSAQKEDAVKLVFKARASANLEAKSTEYGATKEMRKVKRKCKKLKTMTNTDLTLAEEMFTGLTEVTEEDDDEVRLSATWKPLCAAALAAVKTAKKCSANNKKHFIKFINVAIKMEIAAKESKTTKQIDGGFLEFDFDGSTTFEAVNTPEFIEDFQKMVAETLGGPVEKEWVSVQIEEVCAAKLAIDDEASATKPRSKNSDGRRRAPKRGDGRRRRRSTKKRDRDSNNCDGRRRHAKKDDRRRQQGRRLLLQGSSDEVEASNVSRRLARQEPRLAKCPEGSDQIGGHNADIGGCGMEKCHERYRQRNARECLSKCMNTPGCNSFTWAPRFGDRNHRSERVCTMYTGTSTTQQWSPNQVLCKPAADPPKKFVRLKKAMCPKGSEQVGAHNADIGGCGLERCNRRYGIGSAEDCLRKCSNTRGCKSFTWAPMGGDKNHKNQNVCTLYTRMTPTRMWAPNQVMCKPLIIPAGLIMPAGMRLIKENVCFDASKKEGTLFDTGGDVNVGIEVKFRTGGISCRTPATGGLSHWGCGVRGKYGRYKHLSVNIMSEDGKEVIYPTDGKAWYQMDGKDSMSPSLEFTGKKSTASKMRIVMGDARIGSNGDNGGSTCVDIWELPAVPIGALSSVKPRVCTLAGDPHIKTFDRKKVDTHFYSKGDYWVVKSQSIWIQGRYQPIPGKNRGKSTIRELAISSPGGKNRVVIHAKKFGGIEKKPSVAEFEKFAKHSKEGSWEVFTIGRTRVKINVKQHNLDVNVKMFPEAGQSGHCGNSDGNSENDRPLSTTMIDTVERLFEMEGSGKVEWDLKETTAEIVKCEAAAEAAARTSCTKALKDSDENSDDNSEALTACIIDQCATGDGDMAVGAFDALKVQVNLDIEVEPKIERLPQISTCPPIKVVKDTCAKYKGRLAVKVFYKLKVPAMDDDDEKEVRQSCRMGVKFKGKVSTEFQKSSWNSKLKLKAGAKVTYTQRPRPTKAKLTGEVLADVEAVDSATRDCREKYREKAITNYDFMAKANFKVSLKVSEKKTTLGAKATAKLTALSQKVEKGDDLSVTDSKLFAKVSAMASYEMSYKQKVAENEEAKDFNEYYELLASAQETFSEKKAKLTVAFQNLAQNAYELVQDSISTADKTTFNSAMQKCKAGESESLTEGEQAAMQVTLKAGAELYVASRDKERIDFAAEVGARVSLKILPPEDKKEFIGAFDAVAKTFQECDTMRKTVVRCSALGLSNKCLSVTTSHRTASAAMDIHCATSCSNGGDECTLKDLSKTKCMCCSTATEEIIVEDECKDFNEVWRLILAGDFSAMTDKQEKTARKILQDGKTWADVKEKSFRSMLARKYAEAEEYVMNVVDWREVEATMQATIKEAVVTVKAKKAEIHQYLTASDLNLLDQTVKDIECTCKEDITQDQKRVLRVSMNVAVRLEVSKNQEYSAKTLTTSLKLKVKGSAAAKLDTPEAHTALKATFSYFAEGTGDVGMYDVGKVTGTRRLVECAHGRCLADSEVTIPVKTSIPSFDTLGDKDEKIATALEGVDSSEFEGKLKENLKAAGVVDVADGLQVSSVATDADDCTTNCVPPPSVTKADPNAVPGVVSKSTTQIKAAPSMTKAPPIMTKADPTASPGVVSNSANRSNTSNNVQEVGGAVHHVMEAAVWVVMAASLLTSTFAG